MDPQAQACAPRPAQLRVLPQIVPSRVCLQCEVCCRFPEPDSFLRPYFTAEEVRRAIEAGLNPAHFPDPRGGQVRVIPNSDGEGYLCPAFDPATSHCRIYDVRPLDCQLYPFALMWNADGRQVVLGWDRKCPFMSESGQPSAVGDQVETHAARLADMLERDETLDAIARHPRLIGPFQDDVVIVRTLPRLTQRLTGGHASPGTRCIPGATGVTRHLSPLTLADRQRFERAAAACATPLAAYAFPYHFIWRRLLAYSVADVAGHLCLFAESPDGLFMPLPPLPTREGAGEGASLKPVLEACFECMRARNGDRAVSRIENIPEELTPQFEAAGYRLTPKEADYLYRASDLVRLAGDRYKSQRAAYNRFARSRRFRYDPYRPEDRAACLALYRRWAAQQEARGLDAVARQMLEDSALAHEEALTQADALGLRGRVVRVDGSVVAYTLGYERPPSVCCVLLEVADRSLPGLAAFIFREYCREAVERGCAFINTLDDSGLPRLAASKRAYRPVHLVPSWIATRTPP